MEILIVEDEIPAANKLIKLLESIDTSFAVCGTCRTIEETVNWLKSNPQPQLILMDIGLADGKSFEIFEQVKITCPVIFVTAYDEYAIKAIKLRAFDYLLKPVTKAMLAEALSNVKEHKNKSEVSEKLSEITEIIAGLAQVKNNKRLPVNSREGITFIELDSILYLEADSNYTHIYLTTGKKITITRTLKDYEGLLSELGFFRVHNTYIINLKFVDKYIRGEGGQVVMNNGTAIEVSQSRKKELMHLLMIE